MRSNRFRDAALFTFALTASFAGTAHAAGVVISQVYGGGGNSGAPLHNDFIELFNAGNNAQSLSGWSVQYASSAGSTWNNLTLLPDVTLQPGEYFLIQEAAGSGGGDPLPTPDLTGAINMSGTAGKVALVSAATALSGTCPTDASIVDFIGYGSAASCAEGMHTGDLSNTTADLRNDAGCMDTNDNSADFTIGAPAPRNSASAQNPCGGVGVTLSAEDVSVDEGDSGTTTATFTVTLSEAIASDVTFDIATADGTATASSDYIANAVTGATIDECGASAPRGRVRSSGIMRCRSIAHRSAAELDGGPQRSRYAWSLHVVGAAGRAAGAAMLGARVVEVRPVNVCETPPYSFAFSYVQELDHPVHLLFLLPEGGPAKRANADDRSRA